MSVRVLTWAERPDLAERGPAAADVWPEYNLHGDVFDDWWAPLLDELPEYQFALYDEAADVVLAEAHTGPLAWNGDERRAAGRHRRCAAEGRTAAAPACRSTRCARSPPRSTRARGSAGSPASWWAACASSRGGSGCGG